MAPSDYQHNSLEVFEGTLVCNLIELVTVDSLF